MAPEYFEASIVEDSLQISRQEKQTLLSAVRISSIILGPVIMIMTYLFVLDCTRPFEVNFFTDAIADAMAAVLPNRGVCLEYTQLPC